MRACLLLLIALFAVYAAPARADDYAAPLTIVTANGVTHAFMVEVVQTQPARTQGLMHRSAMPADAGMLFLFPDSAERYFWMKNTLIPLDILFIRGDGLIHHVHEGAVPLDLTPIPSNGPVPVVLELNAGTARAKGIGPGDRVLHPDLGNSLAPEPGNK